MSSLYWSIADTFCKFVTINFGRGTVSGAVRECCISNMHVGEKSKKKKEKFLNTQTLEASIENCTEERDILMRA